MLDDLYMKILDMTLVGSLVILAVMAARLLLRRAPKVFSYALWAVVLLRLLCPVTLQAPVSLVPEIPPTAQEYDLGDEPISILSAGSAALNAVGDAVNGGLGVQHIHTTHREPDGTYRVVTTDWNDVWILFGQYVWAAGFAGMLLWSFLSCRKLKRKLEIAVPVGDGIYLADDIASPFVVGLARPRIYLPGSLSEAEYGYIILHERHHIRRGDHIFKALGFLALAVHWFNPLVWLAFVLASRDMEMSCDEAVVRKLGPEIRGDYSASLLSLATGRRIIAGMPLAFGEGDPKGRIRNLSRWKRPALWVTVIAGVLCAVLALCLLTDPQKAEDAPVGVSWYDGTVADRGMSVVQEGDRQGRAYVGLLGNDGREYLFWLSEYYDDMPDIQPGDHVRVRAWREDDLLITSWVGPVEPAAAMKLDAAINNAILNFSRSEQDADAFPCASFVTLAQEEKDGLTTVYGIALHQTYRVENGLLEEVSGSHIPTVLTFGTADTGEYVLSEYWQPRDGSHNADDIRERFPLGVWPDTQEYITRQMQYCYGLAVAHFRLDPTPVIASLLEDDDPLSRRELLYYGRYTLEYCFRQFLTAAPDEVRAEKLAQLCREVMAEMGQKYAPWGREGQAWFDSFAEHTQKLAREYDLYAIREDFPGSWVLLNMTGADGKPVDKTGSAFVTENIASIAFVTPNSPEGLEVSAADLPQIIAWLDTFTIGDRAAEFLAPGSNSVSVRIEYADGTVVENGLSTVIIDGTEFYMDHALAPQCYLDLVNGPG